MLETINNFQLTKDVDLVCVHCGFDHSKSIINGQLTSIEGKDYVFERKDGEEWCICVKCQTECNEKGFL